MNERDLGTRMEVLASHLSAAGNAVLFATVPVAAAEPAIDQAQAVAWGVWYEKHCTRRHGSAGGPGSAVYSGSDEAVDLRRYVARHNGVFPARQWFDVVEQFDHKSPHADVWDKILRDSAEHDHAAAGRPRCRRNDRRLHRFDPVTSSFA